MQFHPEAVDVEVDASRAVGQNLANRYWQNLLAQARVQRQALPVDDQVLAVTHPLQVMQAGMIHGGAGAWKALYSTLVAMATLEEVTKVAPEFEDYLRAAAECLLPFVRITPAKESVAVGGIGALTPLGEALQEQQRRRADYERRNGIALLGAAQCAPIGTQGKMQEIFGTGNCAAAQQLQAGTYNKIV